MEKIRYKAVIGFQNVEKLLDAKTRDEAERQAQDFSMDFDNVDLVDIETIHKDKDSCDEHFEFTDGCNNCKDKLTQNIME